MWLYSNLENEVAMKLSMIYYIIHTRTHTYPFYTHDSRHCILCVYVYHHIHIQTSQVARMFQSRIYILSFFKKSNTHKLLVNGYSTVYIWNIVVQTCCLSQNSQGTNVDLFLRQHIPHFIYSYKEVLFRRSWLDLAHTILFSYGWHIIVC